MIKRIHLWLAGLLVVQIVAGVLVFWPRRTAAGNGQPLLPALSAETVTELTVEDTAGASVRLAQVDGAWVLPDVGDYPANITTVDNALKLLADLTTGRVVARTEASHRQLQVAEDNFVRRVDLKTAEGAYTLFVGSSPSYGLTHVRVAGQTEVYAASQINSWDLPTQPDGWVNTVYLSVPEDTLRRVTVENANGAFTLESGQSEDEEGEAATTWTLADLAEDEEMSASAVLTLVNQATSVNMTTPLGREEQEEYGLAEPRATVTLEGNDGETITLLVGALDATTNTAVVKASNSPFYVRVASYYLDKLVDFTRDSLLQTAETEAETGAEE
ncbi:MAG: DUF4340 domain-containing protein [Anaerolineales bacterium]|nr:DUF4340 domain-containing protein [Anaerolineales bacterium]